MTDIQPEIRSFDIGDTEVEYLFYGGTGPALVMLHATGFLPWLWHPLARELSRDYSVILPYFCDHREGDPDQGGLGWPVLAKDFSALVTGLGLENPFLVGHSMGGTICVLSTTLFGLEPRSMVLIEPIFLPEMVYQVEITVDQHPLASKSIKRRNFWENPKDARDYLKDKPFFASWDPEMLDLYLKYGMTPGESGGLTLACSPRREAALFMGSTHKDPWPLLPEVSCPVMVMEGETSENRSFIDYKKTTRLFPNGKYCLVKDTGHLVPMEKPGETMRLIRDFFQS